MKVRKNASGKEKTVMIHLYLQINLTVLVDRSGEIWNGTSVPVYQFIPISLYLLSSSQAWQQCHCNPSTSAATAGPGSWGQPACGTVSPCCAKSTSPSWWPWVASPQLLQEVMQEGVLFCILQQELCSRRLQNCCAAFNNPSCLTSDPPKLSAWEVVSLRGMLSATDKKFLQKVGSRNMLKHGQSAGHCLKFLLVYIHTRTYSVYTHRHFFFLSFSVFLKCKPV